MSKLYTAYLGLNDSNTKAQEIETDVAFNLVTSLTNEIFDGATVSLASGIYKHIDGTDVQENTIRIEILFDGDSNIVTNYVKKLKKVFNQECVMLTVQETIPYFI